MQLTLTRLGLMRSRREYQSTCQKTKTDGIAKNPRSSKVFLKSSRLSPLADYSRKLLCRERHALALILQLLRKLQEFESEGPIFSKKAVSSRGQLVRVSSQKLSHSLIPCLISGRGSNESMGKADTCSTDIVILVIR